MQGVVSLESVFHRYLTQAQLKESQLSSEIKNLQGLLKTFVITGLVYSAVFHAYFKV